MLTFLCSLTDGSLLQGLLLAGAGLPFSFSRALFFPGYLSPQTDLCVPAESCHVSISLQRVLQGCFFAEEPL